MQNPFKPRWAQLSHWVGFECIIILVPGGAINILLRLCTPLIHAHADNLGLIWEVRNKLIIISLYLNNLFHSVMGKSGSYVANPASRWFVDVRITISVEFLQCWRGGTNSNVESVFKIASLSKWFVDVWIAISATFLRCWRGGTNSNVELVFKMAILRPLEYSLSRINNLVACPCFVNCK